MDDIQLKAILISQGGQQFQSSMASANISVQNLAAAMSGVPSHSNLIIQQFNSVSTASSVMTSSFSPAFRALSALSGGFWLLSSAVSAVVHAIEGATQSFVSFVSGAVQEAAKIERITITLQALSGSAQAARDKMQFLKDFAVRSPLQFDDLAEAGTIIEAGGLRMERILPLLSNIGSAFGAGKAQIIELATAFSRIPTGQFGEVMRVFRRFGIGAGDLMAEGIKINGRGQIVSSVEEMLSATEHIATRKFGAIGELAEKMIAVRFSNLQDAWMQMLAAFGTSWFPLINSILDSFVPMLQFFTKGGIMESMGKAFADVFGAIYQAIGGGTGLQTILAYLIAAFEVLPSIILNAANVLAVFFKVASAGIIGVYNVTTLFLTEAWNTARPIINAMLKVAGLPGYGDTRAVWKPAMEPAEMFSQMLSGLAGKPVDLSKRAGEIMSAFKSFSQKDSLQDPKSFPFLNDQAHPYNRHLEKISSNTAEMVQLKRQDMKQYALGGGDRGRHGISVSELYSRDVNVRMDAGGSKLNEFLGELFTDFLQQAQRDGVLVGR